MNARDLDAEHDEFVHEVETARQGMRYHRVAKECSKIATANGFEATTWQNLPAKLLFVITELDEAHDAEREIELAEELADTAIRLLATLHDLAPGTWCSRIETRRPNKNGPRRFETLPTHFWPIVGEVSKAAEAWRHADPAREDQASADVLIHIELALLEVYRLADRLVVDLDYVVECKIDTNRRRGYLHGKKATVG